MKIKFVTTSIILITCSISQAHANCIGPVVMGECKGISAPYHQDKDDNYSYQSSSSNKYDYDLSKPVDRNRYSLDLDAQRRDSIEGSTSTKRNMDQLKGEYGGGYFRQ